MLFGDSLWFSSIDDHAKSVVSDCFSRGFNRVEKEFRCGRNRLAWARGVVGQVGYIEDFETCRFDTVSKCFFGEEARVRTGEDVLDGAGESHSIHPMSHRYDQRAVVWSVDDQFSAGSQLGFERLENRDRIDQVFDDVHHRDSVELSIDLNVGYIALENFMSFLTRDLCQGLAEFDAGCGESHACSGIESHADSRTDIQQRGWGRNLVKALVRRLEDIREEFGCRFTRVVFEVDKILRVGFIVHIADRLAEGFEQKLALPALLDDPQESVWMHRGLTQVIKQAA